MDYLQYEEWVNLPSESKIPFSRILKHILYAFGNEFYHAGLQVLALNYGLVVPSRKERKCSVKAWFIKNMDHLAFDDRDAIEMMHSSMLETMNQRIDELIKLEREQS